MHRFPCRPAPLACLALVSLLAGCGDSRSGDSVFANAATAVDPKALRISLRNDTDHMLTELEVRAEGGAVVYEGDYRCAPRSFCDIRIAAQAVPGWTQLAFRDPLDRVVAAHLVRGGRTHLRLATSDAQTGLYLLRKLDDERGLDLAVLLPAIDDWFARYDTPTADADLPALLGSRYRAALLEGLTEDHFLSTLEDALENHEILPAPRDGALLAKEPVVGTCPASVGVFADYANFIYAGFLKPELLSMPHLLQMLLGSACASESALGEITSRLDAIEHRLDEIDATLHSLRIDVAAIAQQLGQQDVARIVVEVDSLYTDLETRTAAYQNLLAEQYGERAYPSLADYVAAKGGLSSGLLERQAALKALLAGTGEQRATFLKLSDPVRLQQLSASLESLCRNPERVVGDVVDQRLKCNLVIDRVYTRLAASQALLGLMLRDEANTLDRAFAQAAARGDQKQLDWLRGTFPSPFPGVSGWGSQAQAAIGNLVDGGLETTSLLFTNRMFAPAEGLAEPLLANLEHSGCFDVVDGNKVIGVLAWKNALSAPRAHLLTRCRWRGPTSLPGDNVDYRTARYEYAAFGGKEDSLTNVLGVLVDARVHDIPPGPFNLLRSDRPGCNAQSCSLSFLTPANDVAVNDSPLGGARTAALPERDDYVNADGTFMLVRSALLDDGVTPDPRVRKGVRSLYKTRFQPAPRDGYLHPALQYAFMSYTDPAPGGRTFVWLMSAQQTNPWDGDQLSFAMDCITPDCRYPIPPTDVRSGPMSGIAFEEGPTLAWKRDATAASGFYMTVDGAVPNARAP